MHLMDDGKKRDRSVQDFLDTRPGGMGLPRDRKLASQFVEGFTRVIYRVSTQRAG